MIFKRHFAKRATSCGAKETRPKGILVYTSGSPKFDRSTLQHQAEKYTNKPNGLVHALITADGCLITLPLWMRGEHSGTNIGDTYYLGVAVLEPGLDCGPEVRMELTQRAEDNLAKLCTYLCRYCQIDINQPDFIQLAGTANEALVTREISRRMWSWSECNGSETRTRNKAVFERIQTLCMNTVKQTVGEIAELYAQVQHDTTEHAVDAIGVGDVVLFIGGELFKSRGATTAITSRPSMIFGIVTSVSPKSKHGYEVVFPGGEGTYWVNKSTLVKSPLGHISEHISG